VAERDLEIEVIKEIAEKMVSVPTRSALGYRSRLGVQVVSPHVV
jgi:hypothetical protein